LLAAREAAEEEEVTDTYLRPTGDADTDRLLHEIRREERSHSLAVADLRDGGDGRGPSEPPEKSRLDRILGREAWHRGAGGWLSGAIYGANDGLAAVFGIVAGVSGATAAHGHLVLTAGLAGAAASALSMASGAFLAERAQAEVAAANLEHERREIAEHPEEEKEELSLFYQLKGLSEAEADELAEKLSHNPDAMLQVLAMEELGGMSGGGDPVQAALAGGISTAVGGIIPVVPFFFLSGTVGIVVAAAVSLLAHFAVGAAKSVFTLRSAWSAGLEMTAMGVIVGGGTYLIGLALPT
jgi:VIT1/CCC1 family predicted Fe2+/Mn2+ transporter